MAAPGEGKSRKRSRKNRQNKLNLVFDEEERKDYLKGFRKRKNERRLKAKEEMELRIREEKKRIKEERKSVLMTMYYTNRDIPEVEHLVKPKIYELPNHTVMISSIADVDFQGKDNLLLGQNRAVKENSDIEEKVVKSISSGESRLTGSEEDEGEESEKPEQAQLSNINRVLKRKSLTQMKKSKVLDVTRRLQQRKDRKKFHREKKGVFKKRAKIGKMHRNRSGNKR